MGRKKQMKNFNEADEELQLAILRSTIETRALLRHLREMRAGVRSANRMGTTANFEMYLKDYLAQGMAGNIQRITRQVNTARRSIIEFLEANRRD